MQQLASPTVTLPLSQRNSNKRFFMLFWRKLIHAICRRLCWPDTELCFLFSRAWLGERCGSTVFDSRGAANTKSWVWTLDWHPQWQWESFQGFGLLTARYWFYPILEGLCLHFVEPQLAWCLWSCLSSLFWMFMLTFFHGIPVVNTEHKLAPLPHTGMLIALYYFYYIIGCITSEYNCCIRLFVYFHWQMKKPSGSLPHSTPVLCIIHRTGVWWGREPLCFGTSSTVAP